MRQPIIEEYFRLGKKQIDTVTQAMIKSGWLACFFWEYGASGNPVDASVGLTEKGRRNLRAIHASYEKNGFCGDGLEPQISPFVSELGLPMTGDNLGAILFLSVVCVAKLGNTEA
jgi:hypothetical protein